MVMLKMQDNLIVPFNPEVSARFVRDRIESVDRMTVEAVAEIYRARDHYSSSGFRSDLVPDGTRLNTFESYLAAAGLPRRTAYNWLERYIPEENKLLTYEEFTEKKEADRLAKMSQEERERSLRAEYRKTGIPPAGWTPELEQSEKENQAALVKQQERIDEYKREQNRKSEEEKKRRESIMNGTSGPGSPAASPSTDDPKRDYYYNLGKISDEMLKNASTTRATHFNKRQEWKEKIRLSSGGKEDAFMDAIIEYLETLPDDNRRIEACNNIIKICRNISVELQRNKAA
jgi:hypothetical protein